MLDPDDKYHLFPDPQTGSIVLAIFRMVAENHTLHFIAKTLNEQGVPSPGRYLYDIGLRKTEKFKNAIWYLQTIKKILVDPVYLGWIVSGKYRSQLCERGTKTTVKTPEEEWIINKGMHEPLFPKSFLIRFRTSSRLGKVNRALRLSTIPRVNEEVCSKEFFVAENVVAVCTCAVNLIAVITIIALSMRITMPHCSKKAVKQEDVESLALRLIQTQIRAFSDAQRLIANLNATPSSQTRYQIYETQIDDAKRKIEKFNQLKAALYGDFADGLLSHQDYTDLSEDYSRRADDLRIFIAELEKEKEKYSMGFGSKMQWALLIEKYKDQESLDAEMAAASLRRLPCLTMAMLKWHSAIVMRLNRFSMSLRPEERRRRDMPDKVLAFYIRLSSEDRDLKTNALKNESNSVFNQRRLLQDYYDTHESLHGYKVIVFCDDGVTGTHFDRPKFDELIEMARNQEIHCIMVKDLSRFGRNFLEMGNYLELILPLYGVRFISINDAFDSDDYLGVTGDLS